MNGKGRGGGLINLDDCDINRRTSQGLRSEDALMMTRCLPRFIFWCWVKSGCVGLVNAAPPPTNVAKAKHTASSSDNIIMLIEDYPFFYQLLQFYPLLSVLKKNACARVKKNGHASNILA